MSNFEPATEGITLSQNTSRRISEIMEERGKAYSQQAIATRIKMSSDTLRMKLRGKRKIYAFELERISEALHISVERLLQEDSSGLEQELQQIFAALNDPEKTKSVAQKLFWSQATTDKFAENQYADLLKQRAMEISEHLSSIAIGITERSKSLNQLGRAHFQLHHYQEAHETWLQAYSHAKKLANKTNTEKEPLFNIITNLIISYSNRQEYSELSKILNDVESFFVSDPNRTGIINYSLAKIAEQKGELEKAKLHFYSSLDAYTQTEIPYFIAKALHNTACFEFRTGNFETSKQLFEKALPDLLGYTLERLICTKEYCKALIRIGKSNKAEELLVASLRQINAKEWQTLRGQFTLILSIATNDPTHAEELLQSDTDEKIRRLACRFLMDFYEKRGDSYSLMKFYRIEKETGLSEGNLLFEEDL